MTAARMLTGALVVFAVVMIVSGFVDMAFGSTADRYLIAPSDAGTIVREHAPPSGQTHAWSVGFVSGRILAYYWDLPPRTLTVDLLGGNRIGDDELVLVDRRREPDWFPDGVEPLGLRGNYAIVTAGSIRSRLNRNRRNLVGIVAIRRAR